MTHLTASVALALITLAVACSDADLKAEDMLLGPSDFPGIKVAQSDPQAEVTSQGVSAAQVELTGPDFTLSESVVVFATPASALTMLAGIKQDQLAQNVSPVGLEQFHEASGILIEARAGQERRSIFFIEGRTLVRLTISGPSANRQLQDYATIALDKISQQ